MSSLKRIMKRICMLMLAIFGLCCNKPNRCTDAQITKIFRGTGCEKWGVGIGTKVYPVQGLPSEYEKDSLQVCIVYKLYEDPRMCPCCGGTTVEIISIEKR